MLDPNYIQKSIRRAKRLNMFRSCIWIFEKHNLKVGDKVKFSY